MIRFDEIVRFFFYFEKFSSTIFVRLVHIKIKKNDN